MTKIFTAGRGWFKDNRGRNVILRGVNVSGSSKLPVVPNGATWNKSGFYNHRDVSFVGRPFPLAEADEHFSRLRRWGLTFLRLLVTWEAIEHAGPGRYDEAYLDYLTALVKRAGEFDLCLLIDPHQDVWSRFTGGSGAPGWTLEALGMDITRLHATGAAFTHQEHGDPVPRMIWPGNQGKFGSATMFTLFFGGNDFAPRTTIAGVPVQEFLQTHYLNAVKQVAERLKDMPHVLGYDTLNEPSRGYIGYPDARRHAAPIFRYGSAPTIFQGMALAAGFPQTVDVYSLGPLGFQKTGRRIANPDGLSLWRAGAEPVWRQNGVWDADSRGRPVLLRPNHFGRVGNRTVDFDRDYFVPFARRFIREIRTVDPAALIFVEPVPLEFKEGRMDYGLDAPQLVHAPHWYDGMTLGMQIYLPWAGYSSDGKRFRPVLGRANVRRSFAGQIRHLLDYSARGFNGAPTLIGETGIPFNMHGGQAFRSGDFSQQAAALDDTFHALEANMVNVTLWNYTPDNTNRHGDQWNGEDLSIFSRDQQTGDGSPDDGGRALPAVVRPYAARIPGEPLRVAFDVDSRVFEFEFRPGPVAAPAEFFVPNLHYPRGYSVFAPGGSVTVQSELQRLLYHPCPEPARHFIRITPND